MRSGDDPFQACHAHALYTNPTFLRPDPQARDIRYIPESKGFAWDEDGSVSITALCPQAAQVVMRVGNADTPMRRQADGQWHASLSGVLPGIHACSFLADGIPYINSLMPVGYMGFGISNYFDLPESRSDDCLMHDIPHGIVHWSIMDGLMSGANLTRLNHHMLNNPRRTSVQRGLLLYRVYSGSFSIRPRIVSR